MSIPCTPHRHRGAALRRAALTGTAAFTLACSGEAPATRDAAGSADAGPDAGAATATAPSPAPSDVFRIDSVADGVWVAEVLPRPEAYAFANAVVVAGDSALLVVDTQQSPSAARALIAWIRERFEQPVGWVVNTHHHGDHVNGNGAYRAAWPDVRILAHASVPEAVRTDGRARMEEELATLPATLDLRQAWLDGDTLPEGQEMTPDLRERLEYSVRVGRAYVTELEALAATGVTLPDEGVVTLRTLDLGGRTVDLLPVGPAHSPGDLIVHIPGTGPDAGLGTGVVAVGDLLEQAAPWIEGADLHGWAAALATVRALSPTTVVPSHARADWNSERGDAPWSPALLDGTAALFADLVAAADSVARTTGPAPADADAIAAVTAALEPHRAFLTSLGVEGEAFTTWATDAARQVLAEARERPPAP